MSYKRASQKTITTLSLLLSLSGVSMAQTIEKVLRADKKEMPMQVYLANDGQCTATAIISHGAGGSESGYEYLAEFLRKQHWLVLVVGHKESGSEVLVPLIEKQGLSSGLAQLLTTPSAYKARFMDIAAAKEWAKNKCSTPISVLIGHSMGAASTMIEAGAKNKLGLTGADGFDAYVAMSPQGVGLIFEPNAWHEINKPMLLLTGTKDNDLNGAWETRKDAFASLPTGCKWLGVIDGATHMNFATADMSGRVERLVNSTVFAFLKGISDKNCAAPPMQKGLDLQVK